MRFEKTWTVSSNEIDEEKHQDFTGLVGLWGIQVQISISNPAVVQDGPIVKHILPQADGQNEPPATPIDSEQNQCKSATGG